MSGRTGGGGEKCRGNEGLMANSKKIDPREISRPSSRPWKLAIPYNSKTDLVWSDKPGVKGIIGMHRFNICLNCRCLALV